MKVISFVNMKGGVGKTTLAVNMADFLSYRYAKKVLLIDVDPQFNATQCLLNGDDYVEYIRFLYKGIIIKHNKTEPTYTKTSLFLCEKRRFFMARTEKGVVATI